MRSWTTILLLLILLSMPKVACAQEGIDRVQLFHNITIETGEEAGDAVCIGCSIRVRGVLNGDAVAIGGGIDISGTAMADVVAIGGNIRLGSGARLEGDAVAVAGEVQRDAQVSVGGEVTSLPGLGKLILIVLAAIALFNVVLTLLSYLILGQQRVEILSGILKERAGVTLLVGIGLMTAFVVLCVIFALMGPVTPVMVVVISLALALTLVVGYTGISFRLGRLVSPDSGPLTIVIGGAVLVTLLQLIPVLGLLVFAIFVFLALGSAVLSGYGSSTDWFSQRFAARQPIPPAPPPAVR
jgi:hypothetical protein